MKLTEIELPSNKKFGFFFTFIFACIAGYFYINNSWLGVYPFGTLAAMFFIVTLIKQSLLQPLNKLWMTLGLLLGKIVSPVILAIIFFGLFTPIAFFMRLSRRDELRLKFYSKTSHWKSRIEQIKPDSFKRQF